jgi:hypothetical protein
MRIGALALLLFEAHGPPRVMPAAAAADRPMNSRREGEGEAGFFTGDSSGGGDAMGGAMPTVEDSSETAR